MRRVKALRSETGLTQTAFAKRAGLTLGDVNRLEVGRMPVLVEHAFRIAAVVGKHPYDVFTDVSTEPAAATAKSNRMSGLVRAYGQDAVDRATLRLPRGMRQVVAAKHPSWNVQPLRNERVATLLGKNPGTTEVTYRQGMARLAQTLSGKRDLAFSELILTHGHRKVLRAREKLTPQARRVFDAFHPDLHVQPKRSYLVAQALQMTRSNISQTYKRSIHRLHEILQTLPDEPET